jgi:NAD(P)-dependent dehydrogenase (short-subunit alcohol dehydrogenase family)
MTRAFTMTDLLTDSVAVVTGAMSGNGRAIARTFAENGADVVVADIRDEPREGGVPTQELIKSKTEATAVYVDCDVTETSDLEVAIDAAAELGGVDVMVNNAGIFRAEDFLSVSESAFDRLMEVNLKSVFFGTQLAAERMIADGGGSIINLSSVAGLGGSAEYPTYCASKGAIRLLTYATADYLGPQGVRVNAIHPGLIETTMTTEDVPVLGTAAEEEFLRQIPSGRAGRPDEVADAALYLASEMSSYVTGESLVVDGGMAHTG